MTHSYILLLNGSNNFDRRKCKGQEGLTKSTSGVGVIKYKTMTTDS